MNALKLRIRTRKTDSAYVYHTLEAHEGLSAYRTLPHLRGEGVRDVELSFAPESENDVRAMLADLGKFLDLEILNPASSSF